MKKSWYAEKGHHPILVSFGLVGEVFGSIDCTQCIFRHGEKDIRTVSCPLGCHTNCVKMWVLWSICYSLLLSSWQFHTDAPNLSYMHGVFPLSKGQTSAHFDYFSFKLTLKHDCSWEADEFEVLANKASTEHNQNKENKTANAAKALCNSRQHFMCLSESRQMRSPGQALPSLPATPAAQLKDKPETEWNQKDSKPKITQEGLWGALGNGGLWKKRVVWEEQNGEKYFKPRKALFRPKQVHLATFLAVLKLKAEKQQRESMQATGQSSSFIVPREAEDTIRKQPQALS